MLPKSKDDPILSKEVGSHHQLQEDQIFSSNDPAAKSPAPNHLVPEGEPIEAVSHFQYLGSMVQDDCGMDTDQLQDL